MAKCPKCENAIMSTRFKALETRESFNPGNAYNAIAHCCPSCDSVLSVEIDPVAIRTDMVNSVLKALGKR